jgi:hypothetical protein
MRTFLARLAGAATLVLVSACTGPVTVVADYPSYETVAALFNKATVVVEADVSGNSRVTRDEETDALVVTVRTARVVTAYKGAVRVGDSIDVKEMGGMLEGVVHQEAGGVPLTGDARHVLFLETYPDSPASLLNPTQGQYLVDGSGAFIPVGGNPLTLSRVDLDRLAAQR